MDGSKRSERRRPGARALAGIVGAIAVLAGVPFALAQTGGSPSPEIDRAPRRVDFRSTVMIAGHLDGFEPGDMVTLERLEAGGSWRPVATRAVDKDGRVTLRAERVRVSADYRLHFTDETEAEDATSDSVRVEVEPLLRFRPRPNDVYEDRPVKITGELFPKVSRDRRVVIQQWVDGSWRHLARVPVRDGRFGFSYTPGYRSHRTLRAVFIGGELNASASVSKPLRVYESELATWYGPGFYGNSTACGQRLGYETLGVAHRTLPCGTRVSVFYRGRSITVTVIDRGPYTSAEWDLTGETARRLGFSGKGYVGVAY